MPCCFLHRNEQIVDHLETTLGIKANQTTADGACLPCSGSSAWPIATVRRCSRRNLDYYRNLTPEKVDSLLTELRQRADAGQPLSVSGRLAER